VSKYGAIRILRTETTYALNIPSTVQHIVHNLPYIMRLILQCVNG